MSHKHGSYIARNTPFYPFIYSIHIQKMGCAVVLNLSEGRPTVSDFETFDLEIFDVMVKKLKC